MEWNAQFRALDEDEPFIVGRTTHTNSDVAQSARVHSSQAVQTLLGPDKQLFQDWVNCPKKSRWDFLRHFLRIYLRTWNYRVEEGGRASETPVDDSATWSKAAKGLQERFMAWQGEAPVSVPSWREQLKQFATLQERTERPTEAGEDTSRPQSLEQMIQSRIRTLRESLQAFRAGYEQGVREGVLAAEEDPELSDYLANREQRGSTTSKEPAPKHSSKLMSMDRDKPSSPGTFR
jgi:hypothetical protein